MDNAEAMEAIHKLIADEYLALEQNTQILEPLPLGEDVYDILMDALPEMLSLGIKKEEKVRVVTEDEEDTTVQPKEAHMERIKCPLCEKGYVFEHDKGYGCTAFKSGCKFTLWKKVAGKLLTTSQVEKLVKGETTEVIRGFTNKDGKKFDAALRFQNGKVKFVFQKGNK